MCTAVPAPNVNVTVHNANMVVGQPLTLECLVTTVRGINSQVCIVWKYSSKELKINVSASITVFSSVVYRDYLNISQLSTDDNDVTYECEVIINASPPVTETGRFTLHVNGKQLSDFNYKHNCVFSAVPDFIIDISPTSSLRGLQEATVGDNHTIQCIINTVSGVTLNSVIVNWMGPRGFPITNSSRIMVVPVMPLSSNNSTNDFTSSLQFMYLMEGDEGRYACNVSILQTNASMAIELGALSGKL